MTMSEALEINLHGFGLLVPEIIATVALVIVVFLSMFASGRRSRIGATVVSIVGLGAAFVALALLAVDPPAEELFFGLIALDPFSLMIKILVLLGTLLTAVISLNDSGIPTLRSAEFHILLLSAFLGMSFISGAYHLLTVYLALELISLPSYVMAAVNNPDRRSSEAGIKYLIYGSVSAGVFLYGASLLYGLSGAFTLDAIASSIAGTDRVMAYGVALTMMLVGIGFKCSFFPMHMWVPDVYQGAPKSVGAFLSTAPKAAGIAILIRLGYEWAPALLEHPGFGENMTLFFVFVAAATMTIGNLSALVQDNLKRLLGYSTIAHVGYVMMGFALVGTASMEAGFQAMIYYLYIYTIMNIGAFGVLIALDYEWMDELDGMITRQPLIAVSTAAFMFSLTGLPPLAGFPAKFYLFFEIIGEGGWTFWLLALVGGMNAVISLFYYARVLKHMFLHEADDEAGPISSPFIPMTAVAVLALATLVLGLYWAPLWQFTEHLTVFL